MDTIGDYQLTFCLLDDIKQLEHEWLALESQSNSNIFLSWAWISTWIETFRPQLNILRVCFHGELVALAALVIKEEVRYYTIKSKRLHLHQTGDPKKDQIWIEYNGILTKKEHEEAIKKVVLQYLMSFSKTWDELITGAITEKDALLLERAGDLMRHDIWNAPCYGVDLKKIRDSNTDYLSTLSRNTRYQIKRSIKIYQKSGMLNIEYASNKESALYQFNKIGPLHMMRWGTGVGKSGFANPYFVKFHRNLIDNNWDKGLINLINVHIEGKSIARFYNFIYRNQIYFYLSGLIIEPDSKLKPGLTGHALCIQEYINKGFDFYDFMGGGERYKESLAIQHQHLVCICLQKRKIKFKLENIGRRVKRLLMNDVHSST